MKSIFGPRSDRPSDSQIRRSILAIQDRNTRSSQSENVSPFSSMLPDIVREGTLLRFDHFERAPTIQLDTSLTGLRTYITVGTGDIREKLFVSEVASNSAMLYLREGDPVIYRESRKNGYATLHLDGYAIWESESSVSETRALPVSDGYVRRGQVLRLAKFKRKGHDAWDAGYQCLFAIMLDDEFGTEFIEHEESLSRHSANIRENDRVFINYPAAQDFSERPQLSIDPEIFSPKV